MSRTQIVVCAIAIACAGVVTTVVDASVLESSLLGAGVGAAVAAIATLVVNAFSRQGKR